MFAMVAGGCGRRAVIHHALFEQEYSGPAFRAFLGTSGFTANAFGPSHLYPLFPTKITHTK
jgi:hypothetical protein